MPHVATSLKLNIGCGDTRRPGFIGVDVRPCRGADYVLPAWDLHPFDPETVDEVYSRHALEHLHPDDAARALWAWYHVLRPDGNLRVIVPDLAFHCRQLLGLEHAWTEDPLQNLEHALAGFYGWRRDQNGGREADAHRWGYTWETLSRQLQDIGFTHIRRVTSGDDSEPWHLHVTARKPRREPE